MAITAYLIVVSGDAIRTKFMQAVDMFEPSKVLGEEQQYTVIFEDEVEWNEDILFERCQRIIEKVKEFYETDEHGKKYNLSLIHLLSINQDDKILLNTKGKCKPYINKTVRVISNGEKWGMFHELLTKLGIEFKMDDKCFII